MQGAALGEHRDLGHKPIALPVPCLNDQWRRRRGLDGFAQPGETPRQGRLADKGLGPALLEQFRFGHHPVAVLQEVEQDLKDFRFQGQAARAVPHLSAGGIQRVVMKAIQHIVTVLSKVPATSASGDILLDHGTTLWLACSEAAGAGATRDTSRAHTRYVTQAPSTPRRTITSAGQKFTDHLQRFY